MGKTLVRTDDSGVVSFIYLECCERCGASMLREDLAQHREQCGTAPDNVLPSAPARVLTAPMISCPLCGAKLKHGDLVAHLKRSCPVMKQDRVDEPKNMVAQFAVQPTESPRKEASHSKPKPQLTSCPQCGHKVREDRLIAHMNTRCIKRLTSATAKKGRPGTRKRGTARPAEAGKKRSDVANIFGERNEPLSSMEEAFRQTFDEKRDGSELYAHRYREHGLFGSHPIHDDYSEESGPE